MTGMSTIELICWATWLYVVGYILVGLFIVLGDDEPAATIHPAFTAAAYIALAWAIVTSLVLI